MMQKKENLRIAQGKATVTKIIRVAGRLFSKKGYAKTSVEDIVRKVGVTRGAVYHHFSGKDAIFLAVFEDAQSGIQDRILDEIRSVRDPWQRLTKGNYAFLKACADPKFQQIVAIDAPSALGWETWRRVDAQYSTKLLMDILEQLRDAEVIKPLPIEALTQIIAGASNNAAIWIAQSQDTKRALEEAQSIMEVLLRSLLKKPGTKPQKRKSLK